MPAAPLFGCAGDELARDRLARYQRYAALVAEQEAALEREDMERFEQLGRDIVEARRDIGVTGGVSDSTDGVELRQVADVLRTALVSSQRILERLAGLRRQTGDGIKAVGRGRASGRSYLAAPEAQRSGLDRKL